MNSTIYRINHSTLSHVSDTGKKVIPFNCLLIGPSYVGKTTYGLSLMNGTFTKSNRTTLGRENFSYDYSINNFIYRINLKDFGGQAEFKKLLIDQNFDNLNINGVIVCFDISVLITFWSLDDYIGILQNLKVPLVLCGMQSDKSHQVTPKMMEDYL